MEFETIEIDFITRTESILKETKTEYDVTLLLNLCMGLIIFPKEKHFKSLSKTHDFLKKELCEIMSHKKKVDLSFLIKRIRNSLCHGNFTCEPDSKKVIKSIKFWDYDYQKCNFKDNIEITKLTIEKKEEIDYIEVEFEIDKFREFIEFFIGELKKIDKFKK